MIDDPSRERFRKQEAVAVCETCGWCVPWRSVLKSMQGKELVAGAAERYFGEYLSRYPRARTAREKMLAIDGLLHEFHSSARFGDVRPAAVNVIAGRLRDVMSLLDELAADGTTPGQREWRRRAPESVFGRHMRAKSGDYDHCC